jgi:diaminopropionate ammonia-lyase
MIPQAGYALRLNPFVDRARPYASLKATLSRAGGDAAHAAIAAWPGYRPTPVVPLPNMARAADVGEILMKHEGHRFKLGSFKALGGAYAVERIAAAQGGAGLIVTAATDGNHGRAVAWGASRAGARAVIYVHETVSEGRAAAIRSFGAEVRREGRTYDDAVRLSAEAACDNGWALVSDTSRPGYETIPTDVMQGYAVLAIEARAAGAAPTHVFVQGGVGGLAAGILSDLWEREGAARPIFVVVEPETAACLYASAASGEATIVGGDLETIMAGLACGEPSMLAWNILGPGADAFMTIPDAAAATTMRDLADLGLAVGESGVAGLAGFRCLAADPKARAALGLGPKSRVLVFGTEGATDPDVYREIVGRDAAAVEAIIG